MRPKSDLAATPLPALLPQEWRARAAMFRMHAGEMQAATLEVVAAELEQALAAGRDELLTVAAAADEAGYSPAQLRRMIRQGTIPNGGDVGAPRIRRLHLPRKPGHAIDRVPVLGVSSKRQIARAVAAGK